ncbi:MAG: NADAR domain-containing protein [Acidobacteria bacterium]|nr:NADAR domain-containing protein [Acidobacteriota bacterium]
MTSGSFGGLSNMAPGFPLCINGVRIHTSEALYQACRFPHRPDVQKMIIDQPSPMTAKMKSKPYRGESRSDWDRVRVKIMRWCLRVKLVQNQIKFGALLRSTDNQAIVEESRKDSFWGAKPAENGILVGMNVLGRLLMELREEIKNGAQILSVEPLSIADFLLLDKPISEVRGGSLSATDGSVLDRTDVDKQLPQQLALISGDTNRGLEEEKGFSISPALHSYTECKVSHAEWLGALPSHWRQLRAKFLFREVDERSISGKEELLSVSHLTGVTPRSEKTVTMFLAKSNVGHKVCRPNDVVINTMWAWMGALGVSKHTGIVSPSYGVYRPINAGEILPQYVDHLLRTPYYVAEYRRRSTGVNSSRLRLYPEHFLGMPVVIPPLKEQDAIVRFLDNVIVRIARAIRAKRKLIALLEEQKLAIIQRAVTRGLDSTVPLKPSGIGWLGEIPDHWDLQRLKFNAHIKTGGRDTVDRVDEGMYPFFVRSQTVQRINTYSFDGEAVLTAGDGAGVAKVFHHVNGKFDYHQRVYKFSDFQRVNGQFFFYYLKSTLRFEALDASAKSTVDSLRLPMLQNFPIVIPPTNEQRDIIQWINRASAPLDDALLGTEREIRMLREYRTRLVADAVTGKMDVRLAVQDLPDPTEQLEVTDDEDFNEQTELMVDE